MSTTTATRPAEGPGARRRRLPFTIYVLAGLVLVRALLLIAIVAGANVESARPVLGLGGFTVMLDNIREEPAASAVLLGLAFVMLASVVGILSRRRIGWLLAMVVTGMFVAIDIYGFINNIANHLWMGLNILTVFYLNQQDVREAVGAVVTITADPVEATVS
jgi:cytochrome c biogenesis protein ResB